MKKFTLYPLVLAALFCWLSTAYAVEKNNLLFVVVPSIAANNKTTCNELSSVVSIVTSNGQIWMDRNLGASQVATSFMDAAAYGDLYQWGRGTDGHEKRTSSSTSTYSNSDVPGHDQFIATTNDSATTRHWDWRDPSNNNLWQGKTGINNPCPCGYRLPTIAEWETERSTWVSNKDTGAFASPLKLVMAGYRGSSGDTIYHAGSFGYYWSSTPSTAFDRTSQSLLIFDGAPVHPPTGQSGLSRAQGASVRCIKD